MRDLCSVMRNYGVTTEEMCNVVLQSLKIPFTETDIVLIKSNPSLSLFQKWRLVRKYMKMT